MRALALPAFAAIAFAGCLTSTSVSPAPDEVAPCATMETSDVPPGTLPPCIRAAADAIAERYLGPERFARMLSFDEEASADYGNPECHQEDAACEPWWLDRRYNVAYELRSPEQPWFRQPVHIYLEPDGRVSMDHGPSTAATEAVDGLPMCRVLPRECRFIEESTAINVARMHDLEPGIEPWTTRLFWRGPTEVAGLTYVWAVENTTRRAYCLEEGRTIYMDANDGRVFDPGQNGPKWVSLCAV